MNVLHPASPPLRRPTEWPIWDQIDSESRPGPLAGTAQPSPATMPILDLGRLGNPAMFFGRLMYPRQAPGRVEVSAIFTKAWKKEIYDAWVDLDLLPAFMRGLDNSSEPESFELPWFLKLGDGEVRWEARTTECVPGERISWAGGESVACRNNGYVTFAPEGRAITRVSVSLQFEVSGATAITDQTLKSVEFQLRDTLALLHIFLAPHALPPALACL